MSVVGPVGEKFLRLMILLVFLGWGASGYGSIQALAQDTAVADPAPVQDPPGESAQDDGAGKAEETPGLDDLDKAFDLKINSQSTRDLDKVARLCEQAIEKGLNDAGEEQAKVLAKTAYYEHAKQLSSRILPGPRGRRDPRWKALRREALRRLAKAVEIDPEMASAYVLTAKLQRLALGDREKGKAAINQALSLIQGDDELMSEALIEKVRLSDDILADSVMDDVDEAIRLNPENREARGLRSQLLMRSGKIEKAFEDLDAVLESAGSYDAYASQADQLMQNPKFTESEVMQNAALRYLDKAMELKSAPRLLLAKAIVLQTMDKTKEALAAIDQNLEAEPDNYKALKMRSAINADQKRIKAAIADLDQALELETDDPDILLRRMSLHQIDDNLDAAIEDCKRLNDGNKGNFPIQMSLAQLYLVNDQASEAVGVIDKALEQYGEGVWDDLSPAAGYEVTQRRLRALRMRGDCHLHTGDHQNAIDDYELGVDLTEDIAEFKRSLPRPEPPKFRDGVPEPLRMETMKKWDEMTEELDKEYIGDSGLLNNLAWVLATSTFDELRDGERAIELATTAAELTDFKKAFIISTLASGYAEVGEFEKAREWSNKAIEVNRAEFEAIKNDEEIKDEAEREARIKIENDQFESLKKELASYEMEKPWRERQTSEKEEAAAAEQEATAADEDKEGDEDKEDDEAEDEDGDGDNEDGSEEDSSSEQESEPEMSDTETEENESDGDTQDSTD